MTSIPAALKNNFGAEFDMSSGLIHLTLGDYLSYQAGSFIPQVDLALLSADLNIKSGALPVPKVWLIREPHTGNLADGNTVACQHYVMVSLYDMPDAYLQDPAFELQLELLRYKSRIRNHKTRKGGAGFVHPSNFVGGSAPAAVRGTRGGKHFSMPYDRQTEWLVAGLGHNAVIKIPLGDTFTRWFDLRNGAGFDVNGNQISPKYLRYRTGKNAWWGLSARRSVSNMRQTGVFRFRWSYYDPVKKERVSGPESANIIVYNKTAASLPRWMLGLPVQGMPGANDGSHILNPNLLSGIIELAARINAREYA